MCRGGGIPPNLEMRQERTNLRKRAGSRLLRAVRCFYVPEEFETEGSLYMPQLDSDSNFDIISFHFNAFQFISSRFNSFQFSDFDGMSIRVILIHPNSIPLNSIDICRLRDRDAQSSEQQPMGLPSSGTPAKNWDSQRPVQHNQRDSLTPGLADCRTEGLPLTGTPGFFNGGTPSDRDSRNSQRTASDRDSRIF